jgi:glycosyltransferase involved in cell wall biosynthesis
MTPYIGTIRRFSNAGVFLRSHNLEYIIWERIAEGSRNLAKKSYLKLLARQLKKYELRIFEEVNGIIAISSTDEKKYLQLGYEGPITTVPFGIDTLSVKPAAHQGNTLTLFHLGSMDWTPNLEGVNWFLDEVWPAIHNHFPGLKLHLAGRAMPEEIAARKDPDVIIDGAVENAGNYMQQHGVMIVPLRSAGGIRVKIIEGMALGKVIISTSIGAEGIDCESGKNILIANTPEEFLNAITLLKNQPEAAAEIGNSARNLVVQQFDIQTLTKKMVTFFTENSPVK